MRKVLTVREPFGGHPRGRRIDDQESVEEILAGPNAHHVIVCAVPDEPAAKPEQKPDAKSKV